MTDGRSSKAFVQIDAETKQVMYVPTPIIARNLKVLAEVMRLGTVEVNGMQHGEPLTVVVDGESATVGIDLHAKTGIRFCSGDAQQWRNQPKREWDKYTFGCYGCWIMDDVKQMFDLGFIIFHVLYELSDEDASSGTQNSNGKPKCGRCLSFPVASIDMYISFVFHIVDL